MENKDLQTIIDQLADDIIANIKSNLASYGLANGNLYNSLEPNINLNNDSARLQILANDYFDYAQVGRGPGGVPNNFTDILSQWVQDRNIQVDDTRQFVNSVKWKTIREGSYLYRHPEEHRDFLSDVLDEPLSKFQEKFHIFIKDKLQ